MTYAMVHQPGSNTVQSPFRVIIQKTGRQVDWINHYLHQSCVRGLARHTLRSYALDLLHFVRWWADRARLWVWASWNTSDTHL
jgi:hypothetical protein